MTNRAASERFGRWGEDRAALYLRLKGWRILDRRIRLPAGEVDIVARRGQTIAFVEVKSRRSAADLTLAVDKWRLRRVAAAATMLFPRYARKGETGRIDVILIAPRCWPQHIENALPY